jgi:DNA polymerase III delta prime subunit
MSISTPSLIVLAGPNGAGKTTAAPALLREVLGVVEYVNADSSSISGIRLIAAGAGTKLLELADATKWRTIQEEYAHG